MEIPFAGKRSRSLTAVGMLLAAAVGLALGRMPALAAPDRLDARAAVPKAFADAPAVVLEDTNAWDVYEDGTSILSVKRRILLLAPEGFDHADQRIFYGADRSKISRFGARTHKPDGTVVDVPQDLRRDSIVYKDESSEYRVLQFTFPAVEVGAIIEWEYHLGYAGNRRWTWWEVQRDIPVLQARLFARARPPKKEDMVLKHHSRVDPTMWCRSMPHPPQPKFETEDLVCRNVPAFEEEDRSPPEDDIRLRILFTWDHADVWSLSEKVWAGVNKATWGRIEKFTLVRNKAKARAAEIVRFDAPASEKVDRVYTWVRKHLELREGAGDGLEGARGEAESVDMVLERGGGLPDEITLLTYVLLREAGVIANPVLVGDRSEERFVFDLPDWDQARHLMLQVVTGDRTGYLDPSCRFCQAGVPDWRYCGGAKSGVLIDGQGIAAAVDVPPIASEYNSERRTERVMVSSDGSARVEGNLSLHGQQDVEWRNRNEDLGDEARGEVFKRTLGGDIDNVTVTTSDPKQIEENVRIQYGYSRRDVAGAGPGVLLIRPSDTFTRQLSLPLNEERRTPVWWRFARSVRTEMTFVLPEGFTAPSFPGNVSLEGPGLRFVARWSAGKSEGEIVWTGLLLVQKTEIEPADYPKARELYAGLRKALSAGVMARNASTQMGRGGSGSRTPTSERTSE